MRSHPFTTFSHIVISTIVMVTLLLSRSQLVQAACPVGFTCAGGCTYVGQCVGNVQCVSGGFGGVKTISPGTAPCGSAIVGGVTPPVGVARYNFGAQLTGGSIGIMLFISNAIKLFAVVCGILVFVNFLYSGYLYITGAGNAETHTKVRERLTWSVLGLVLLIAAYMAIALFSLLIYGDAGFILNPDLAQYGALAP